MSYQVLARKWRPKNFSQVVGQQHVLTALSNALDQNKVHHAYLFSGTRGVGKTTIARIFAKSLNCIKGVTSDPCGECDNCLSIDEGRFVDLLEIDAASRTKVDDTRELLDNVQYKPAIGQYKVYLIDEVHMLSKNSFNALLKTLEEPPEYVKFLLATTDPQKLPITVLSRCLQFHLKAIQPQEIEGQLTFILQQEKATFEHSALSMISKAADGSIRDALSLTDQALAFGSGNIAYQDVLNMLGTIDQQHLHYLLHFIVAGNVDKAFEKIDELSYLGADFGKLHQELAGLCHQISLAQFKPSKNAAQDDIQKLSDCLSPEEVQLYYQIATQGFKDYAYAPSGKIALEMTVMRLLAFKPATQIDIPDPDLIESVVTAAPSNNVVEEPVEALPPVIDEANELSNDQILQPEFQENITPDDQKSMSEPIAYVVPENIPQPTIELPVNIELVEMRQPVTHSRNMLRSHREKREQAKKTLATTENNTGHTAPTVVALTSNLESKPEVTKLPSQVESVVAVQIKQEIKQTITPPLTEDKIIEILATEPVIQNKTLDIQPASISVEPFYSPTYFIEDKVDHVDIDIALYVADKLTDSWSIIIQQMNLNGLVKLLAKNTVMKQIDHQIVLTLKASQQHLLNNPNLGAQLEQSLKVHFGQETTLYIEIGSVTGCLTAQESEFAIFERYLNKAKQSLVEDQNITQFVSAYSAKIYENSIIPL